MWTTKVEVMESPNLKARVICNPASSGGAMSPKSFTESWKATISSGSLREAPETPRRLLGNGVKACS